ncbi:MAG: 1-acyl-sn-glycerol-3-phosphate acyltransferase [Leptospiraceae bacterium]|nr:1-acyl-sn-glycerol-3-phosphate acyltransferase [Leptospiraceae bacterium]MCP5510497.1 1-acyl-sn-glycerol-3-phosphate acyltransferase [Leptospiraceae bacterium]
MEPFIPPGFNLPLNWTADLLFPVLLRAMHNINEVIIKEEDKQMIRKHRNDRLLFFSNHPSTAEPPIAFHIGNIMGTRFKYMASRQVFDWGFGMVGKAISNIGAFSVIAGINDRESLKTARQSLAEPGGKLVLFPEGEPTSGENDSLMPFQDGIAALSFWALEDAKKKEKDADITILPAFMRFVVDAPKNIILEDLDRSLKKLETHFAIRPGEKNILRRFLTVGKYMLLDAEEQYKIKDADQNDFDYRIGRVRHAMLDKMAEKLKPANYDMNADAIMKLRTIFALLEMISIDYPDPKLPKLNKDEIEYYKREAVKAFDFIVIKRDYLLSYPTPERFYEWLTRYESYVFGDTPRALGGVASHLPRKAYVFFAKPYSLNDYHADYKKNKKETIKRLLGDLRTDLQGMLDSSMGLTYPLFKPYDIGE